MGYSSVFGGNTIYPSDVSYLALPLTADVELQWPLEAAPGPNVVARIIDVTPSGTFNVIMPPADQTGTGQVVQFRNQGPHTFTVVNNLGGSIISVADGEIWTIYLTDNSTPAGAWGSFQAGSVLSQAQAADLAGYGIIAIGDTLAQAHEVNLFNSNYTAGAPDRASAWVWTGGLGTFSLPAASAVGNDWFLMVRNNGAGNLTIACDGSDLINDKPSLTMRPGDSAIINTDGTSFFTVGLGQDPVFAFDFTVIDLTGGPVPYVLSGAELNRIAYQFTGVLTANQTVIVPSTTQQYWIANDTTGGSYTLSVATATQVAPLVIPRGSRGIYYCQGSEVVKADTASIALPIAINDGGTGASTASGARVNLGGTTVGIALFTAANEVAGRTALGATATGSALFTAASPAAGRTALGATPTGSSLFTAADAATALAVVTPLTTKGDLFTFGSASTRLPVGADGQVLTADSAETTGLKWTTAATGTVTSVAASGGTTGLTFSGSPITSSGTLTLGGTLEVAHGGTGTTSLTGIVKGNGASAMTAATAGTDYVSPSVPTTFTAKQTFDGAVSELAMALRNATEDVQLSSGGAGGTLNIVVPISSVWYYGGNATGNWTVNIRGSDLYPIDSLLNTGESLTVALIAKQGATAYYNTAVQVQGTTSGVTTVWQNGPPSAGTPSGTDVYTYTVLKTGAGTFVVFASQAGYV